MIKGVQNSVIFLNKAIKFENQMESRVFIVFGSSDFEVPVTLKIFTGRRKDMKILNYE